jgi:hypothetical protein
VRAVRRSSGHPLWDIHRGNLYLILARVAEAELRAEAKEKEKEKEVKTE